MACQTLQDNAAVARKVRNPVGNGVPSPDEGIHTDSCHFDGITYVRGGTLTFRTTWADA